jgi:hypothetical protein
MPDVYAERLEGSGFRVTPQLLDEQTDDAARMRYGLDSDEPLFICKR